MTPLDVLILIVCVTAGALIGRRRRTLGALSGLGVALVALAAVSAIWTSHPHAAVRDYHDPAQLAEAVKSAEGSASASCGHLTGAKYFCAVAYGDGTSANYTVTVAADGSSYTAS